MILFYRITVRQQPWRSSTTTISLIHNDILTVPFSTESQLVVTTLNNFHDKYASTKTTYHLYESHSTESQRVVRTANPDSNHRRDKKSPVNALGLGLGFGKSQPHQPSPNTHEILSMNKKDSISVTSLSNHYSAPPDLEAPDILAIDLRATEIRAPDLGAPEMRAFGT